MIDYLISHQTRQIWSYILKDMKFLIFRDFCRIFPNFSKIILNLFGFKKNKKNGFSCALTWQLTWWVHRVSPCRAHACTRERVLTHMCARVCAHVRSHGICGISILFRIYANPLNTHSFCIRFSPQILSFGTIFLFIFIAGDVAQSGAFNLRVKSKSLIVT